MSSYIRQAGREFKRRALWLALKASTTPRKARYNSLLNWREFWQGRTRLLSFPRHIQVGTNLTCNLKCVFCRRQHPEEKKRLAAIPVNEREMSDTVLDKLLRIMPFAEDVNLTPYGEPLLFSRLTEFLKRYRKTGCHNLGLTTNGYLIDDKTAELLVKSGLKTIFFSIDSCEPDTYAGLRVGSELGKVEEGIEAINRWKENLNMRLPRLVLAATFMRRNIEELPAMIEFCHRHKFDEISVQMMEVEVPEMEPESLRHFTALTRSMLTMAKMKATVRGVGFRVHLAIENMLSSEKEQSVPRESIDKENDKTPRLIDLCHYPWFFIYVDTNGDVRPCCYASICLGNLEEEPFNNIWNGAAAIRMRQQFLDNVVPLACQDKHCMVDHVIANKEEPERTRLECVTGDKLQERKGEQ